MHHEEGEYFGFDCCHTKYFRFQIFCIRLRTDQCVFAQWVLVGLAKESLCVSAISRRMQNILGVCAGLKTLLQSPGFGSQL
jgi:hypothetical protein